MANTQYFDEDSDSQWSDDDQQLIGLFDNKKFDNLDALLTDARDSYNFDFYGFQNEHNLDQYGCIRLINFIRSEIVANRTNPEVLVLKLLPSLPFLADDKYYKPVLENDALLFAFADKDDSDNEDEDEDDGKQEKNGAAHTKNAESLKTDTKTENEPNGDRDRHRAIANNQPISTIALYEQENDSLRAMNKRLTAQINEMRKTFHRIVLNEEFAPNAPSQRTLANNENDDDSKVSSPAAKQQPPRNSRHNKGKTSQTEKRMVDGYYFDGYGCVDIHETMLRDRHRTLAYKDFMFANAEQLFKDKVVMDVGCGTGVLSIFAAKCGAKHVIAVDMADIAQKAKRIVQQNGFADRITVIQDKLENIHQLPHGLTGVDVIVSEWMGYCLLYESMLSSVIFARNTWMNLNLKPLDTRHRQCRIFPNQARMFMAGFDYDAMESKFWSNCYDIDMSVMYKRPAPTSEPLILSVDAQFIRTQHTCFKTLDMHTVTDKDLDFTEKFELIATQDGAVIDALVIWFDCLFENNNGCGGNSKSTVCLTTSPDKEDTHWYSTVLLLPQRLKMRKSQPLQVELNASRCEENMREYVLFVTIRQKDGKMKPIRQLYNLNACQPAKP